MRIRWILLSYLVGSCFGLYAAVQNIQISHCVKIDEGSLEHVKNFMLLLQKDIKTLPDLQCPATACGRCADMTCYFKLVNQQPSREAYFASLVQKGSETGSIVNEVPFEGIKEFHEQWMGNWCYCNQTDKKILFLGARDRYENAIRGFKISSGNEEMVKTAYEQAVKGDSVDNPVTVGSWRQHWQKYHPVIMQRYQQMIQNLKDMFKDSLTSDFLTELEEVSSCVKKREDDFSAPTDDKSVKRKNPFKDFSDSKTASKVSESGDVSSDEEIDYTDFDLLKGFE